MNMERVLDFRGSIVAALLLAATAAGCAGGRSRGTSSLSGADMLRGPAGVTYPAAAFGVDLVQRTGEAPGDARVMPASAPDNR